MAIGTRFGSALRWVAGVGLVSNWLARKRKLGTTEDAHIRVSAPVADQDLKVEIYRLRGETVSVGGMAEWIIATLASRFEQSRRKNPRAQWTDLKRHIKSKGLNVDLQRQIAEVTRYFEPRNLAAHAGMIVTGVAEATQIFRFYRDKGKLRVELVTVDKLEEELAVARVGYDAIRAIGCALDDDDPAVLAVMNDLTKGILLGRI